MNWLNENLKNIKGSQIKTLVKKLKNLEIMNNQL